MSAQNEQERTEKPTLKRRTEARRKGNVAHSAEISSAVVLLFSLLVFYFAGPWMCRHLTAFMREMLQGMGAFRMDDASSARLMGEVLRHTAWVLLPLMLAAWAGGIAANVAQVGFLISGEALSPKFSKLNPLEGIKRFVSLRSLVELVKSLVKILTVGAIAYIQIRREAQSFPRLIDAGVGDILVIMGRGGLWIGLYACMGLMFLAGLDYLFQRWRHERDLRMTRQEVRDETRQMEGDQQIKARIRRTQMEMSRRRMMQTIPDASVIVANPEHLAIAIRYDPKKMAAPVVTAKGADIIARRIKEIAREHAVPIVENKPLARTLYKSVDIGKAIPSDLYRAVAEVLAYVYRLKRG
ncbi:flagellar biosynthesis protein FlhB [Desulfococcus sp.]|uniref:flagellar biosynthesis protein FlhB n=1 Tax=Desulfococcus sp. TaxID=2025834 RepID=UPI0035935473